MASLTPSTAPAELRGSPVEVATALLREGREADVLALIQALVADNQQLARKLADLQARRGQNRSSEAISAAQLALLLNDLPPSNDDERQEADDALRKASEFDKDRERTKNKKPARKRAPRRRPLPDTLRRVDNLQRVPDEERACPACGGERACIGHDVTEIVDVIPAEVIVRLDRREKLACMHCPGQLVRAPVGDKVVASGRYGCGLVAQIIVDKYHDGLPLHRQANRFERLGLDIPVSTLADQVRWGTELLQPVARACLDAVLSAAVMHLDATGLRVLTREKHSRRGDGAKYGALWGFIGDNGIAAYLYNATGRKRGQRPGEWGPEDVLERRTGLTVADASNLFDRSFARPELIECGCNMHARRYFVVALEAGDNRAAIPVAAFKKIYDIESRLGDADPPARLAARQARSKPIYDQLITWCLVHQPHEPPRAPMGRAIRYLLNHREALTRFLDDGRIPPDNSLVERLHIRPALTRKNFLFAGSDAGGDRAAIAYTILGSCRLANIDPTIYLTDVLPRLARGLRPCDAADFIPVRWQAAQLSAADSAQT